MASCRRLPKAYYIALRSEPAQAPKEKAAAAAAAAATEASKAQAVLAVVMLLMLFVDACAVQPGG